MPRCDRLIVPTGIFHRIRLKVLCVFLIAWLYGRGTAVATTYYVATKGNDASPGTIDEPLRSASKALSQVKAGDTVVFRAGRYPPFEVRNLHGTADAWITFRAYPGERVTIDRYLESRKDVYSCIYIFGRCSYLIVEGFELTNSNPLIDELRLLSPEKPDELAQFLPYVEPSESRRGDIFNSGVRINPPSNPPHHHHLVFRNLEIHHFLGMGFSGRGDDVQFLNNHVYDLGRPRSGYGWYTSGDRNVYRGNVVHDNIYGFHLYSEGGKVPLRDSIIENNVVYNNGGVRYYHMSSRKVHGGGAGVLVVPGENNIIRNNLIVNNGADGIHISSSNTRVVHNTVYGNRGHGISSRGSDTVIKNNIFYDNRQPDPAVESPGNYVADPNFKDPAASDFHLRPDSPAINACEPMPEVTADLDGLVRPLGSAPDMGAYEFVASPTFRFSLSGVGSLSVDQAASVSTPITAAQVSGAAQAISLVVLGLPRDTAISVVPMSATPPSTVRLTLTPTVRALPGDYPVLIAASAGGATQNCRLSLTISARKPNGFRHLVAHDIRDDGLFWERSPGYHHFVLAALAPWTEAMAHCGVDLYGLEVLFSYHFRETGEVIPWPDNAKTIAEVRALCGVEQHGALGDPRFVDADKGDFRVKPGSPAVGLAEDGGTAGAFPAVE